MNFLFLLISIHFNINSYPPKKYTDTFQRYPACIRVEDNCPLQFCSHIMNKSFLCQDNLKAQTHDREEAEDRCSLAKLLLFYSDHKKIKEYHSRYLVWVYE